MFLGLWLMPLAAALFPAARKTAELRLRPWEGERKGKGKKAVILFRAGEGGGGRTVLVFLW